MNEMNSTNRMDLISFLETDHRKLLRAKDVARIMGISYETVYDWKYRSIKRRIPEGMFVKVGRMLFVRSDLLKGWILTNIAS